MVLGGPVVVFVLVVLGGFKLVPNPTQLRLTAFVHGPAGRQDLVLQNAGQVVLDLGPDRRREKIGDKGEASNLRLTKPPNQTRRSNSIVTASTSRYGVSPAISLGGCKTSMATRFPVLPFN